MLTHKLTEAKSSLRKHIKGPYRQRMERIHGDLMQSFLDAYRRLDDYTTQVESEKDTISKRLQILDERIETFKTGTVAWPQKFEARLLEIVRNARSVGDLEFEVQKLIDCQENEFDVLLSAYRTLQPTTPLASKRE